MKRDVRKKIHFPLLEETILELKAGDLVLAYGIVFTARDQAHREIVEFLKKKERLPFSLSGSTIFYCGPTFKEGKVTSCGPTTSSRMDSFVPFLVRKGLKGMIGKGRRSEKVISACRKYKSLYFAAPAGCAAVLSQCITDYELIGFEDLGPEAIYKFIIKDFPLIVVIDARGNYLYSQNEYV